MPRKKKFQIEAVEDPVLNKLVGKSYVESLKILGDISEELEERMDNPHELFTVKRAYEYLKEHGVNITFRSFSGRIERGKIPVIKMGRKRYIAKEVLDNIIDFENKYYNLRDAYKRLKKVTGLTYRAFLGRVEKKSIPYVKINGKRYIPRDIVDTLVHLHQNYYTISEAINVLKNYGINIRRNTFERRVDRNVIPHIKLGGKRYIHKDVLDQLIKAELSS